MPGEAPAGPPSILIVTLDTTRADALGCYGSTTGATPNLDRLAETGQLFERCETAVPQTLPSHTTIFSGLEPFNHGVRKNAGIRVGRDVPLLAEELAGRGYATGAFVSAFVVDGRFGLDRGFEIYDAPRLEPRLGGSKERRADATIARALEWIPAQTGPWFAWVHLFDPHVPYDPPAPFAARFASPYTGEVAFMDAQLGVLLEALDARGVLDDTLLAVCGDHGEALGEHGEDTHGILLYEATTRVPLLVRLPGERSPARHQAPVGLVDLANTVREAVGLPTAGDGTSLLPLLWGEAAPAPRPPVYLESAEGYLRSGWAPLFAVVDGRFKYIQSPRPELYDVVADPDELRDLVAEGEDVAAELRRVLDGRRPQHDSFEGPPVELSAEERVALLSLGYVSGSPGAGGAGLRNPADAIRGTGMHLEALEAMERGDLERAAALFREELENDPDSAVVLTYLGTCERRSDPRRAAERYRRAIELRPAFEGPYIRLCEHLHQTRQPAGVRSVAEEGLRQTQDVDGQLHFFRALGTFVLGGDPASALADLDVTLARAAEPAPAYRLRAAVKLRRLGDADGALEDLASFAEWATPAEAAWLSEDPAFVPLSGDPRFAELLRTRAAG